MLECPFGEELTEKSFFLLCCYWENVAQLWPSCSVHADTDTRRLFFSFFFLMPLRNKPPLTFFILSLLVCVLFFLSFHERPLYTSIRWNSFCPWISRRVTWASSAESEPAQFWVNCSFNTHVHFLDKPTRCRFTSPSFTFLWPIERNADEIPALNPRAPPQHREKYIYIFFYTRAKINVEWNVDRGPSVEVSLQRNERRSQKKTAHFSFSNVCK